MIKLTHSLIINETDNHNWSIVRVVNTVAIRLFLKNKNKVYQYLSLYPCVYIVYCKAYTIYNLFFSSRDFTFFLVTIKSTFLIKTKKGIFFINLIFLKKFHIKLHRFNRTLYLINVYLLLLKNIWKDLLDWRLYIDLNMIGQLTKLNTARVVKNFSIQFIYTYNIIFIRLTK